MNGMKSKLSVTGGLVFLGISILFSSCSITTAISELKNDQDAPNSSRFEMITPNESNIIIFDTVTGEYWRKFIEPNEGPTNWEMQESPVSGSN
ncbi:hypothetical protein [Mangrovibacillus cuniculi]|uniref:Uncharacterized protein n=1 Tax=Mangrovibacillus cuniculi TaxID=2593652 RepID=A0A7S8C9G1_9BACI|nr:hypothetical protein [Mangrovibacillus cuniculi]QPC45871.1 hypothetical protein G8O30_02305 [Mangrovibacillus cuniculi]